MTDIRQRLEKGVATLALLAKRRQDTRTPMWGYDTECLIISRELQELESEILREPGALEAQLVRVRRSKPKADDNR